MHLKGCWTLIRPEVERQHKIVYPFDPLQAFAYCLPGGNLDPRLVHKVECTVSASRAGRAGAPSFLSLSLVLLRAMWPLKPRFFPRRRSPHRPRAPTSCSLSRSSPRPLALARLLDLHLSLRQRGERPQHVGGAAHRVPPRRRDQVAPALWRQGEQGRLELAGPARARHVRTRRAVRGAQQEPRGGQGRRGLLARARQDGGEAARGGAGARGSAF